MLRLKPLIVIGACAAYIACAEATGPVDEHADHLTDPPIQILRQASKSSLETYEASFRACHDESETVVIRFRGGDDDDEFLRLKVPSDALWRWPDGRRFDDDECVRISVTADPTLLLVEFQPHGLVFKPDEPVELRIYYTHADPDFNGDGVVDERDEDYELSIWRLPHEGESWQRLDAEHNRSKMRFDAELESFSHYAIAH